MVWDECDVPSEWSNIADWSMGLLCPSDWKAQWIGNREDIFPDSTLTFPAPYFRKEFVVAKPIKKQWLMSVDWASMKCISMEKE